MARAGEQDRQEVGESVVFERGDGAAWIRLNRPERMNALSPEMIERIATAVAAARRDPEVRVLLFAASGKAFCAGADLGEDDGPDLALLERSTELMSEIEDFPQPTVAVVNGIACAGGLELVLCCDLVVAAEAASFGDVHAKVGLLPGAGGAYRLPRRLPRNLANFLLFTGEVLPARRLWEAGLVNAVVPDEELDAAATRLATTIASRSPLGLSRMKQLAREGLEQPRQTAMDAALAMNDLHNASDDAREGLAAFAERRPPRFGAV
jgi:enoyl-CoA hydratase/carnithine racemase